MAQEAVAPMSVPMDSSRRSVWTIFAGLMLVMLLASLDSTIVSTALPTIVGDLGGLSHLSWVVTAYLLAETIATPISGKLGDLYGRKRVMQGGVILFLIGSALCGLSQNLTQLIFFRAIQGLGGGGLIVVTQAAIGDVVPPRDRGRYQGAFGAVFGVSSVAGPLLGGYITSTFSWHWIFYVNIPIGLLALAILSLTFPQIISEGRRTIDYLGTGLLAITLTAIVLATDFGGNTYDWFSWQIIGLVVIVIVGLIAFITVERRAKEPVMPMHLFRKRIFVVSSTLSFIVGFALFGSITYLPLYLQIVKGSSPTRSGLELLPLMAGLLLTSIGSGILISRWGKYRIFPIIGTAVMSIGLFLLSRLETGSSMVQISASMFVLGFGLGLVMQVLVLAVQNAVDYADLGAATSGVTLFRLIGGSIGTAILGSLFASRLDENVAKLPAEALASLSGTLSPASISNLPAAIRDLYQSAYTDAITSILLVAAVISVAAFVVSWALEEHPLRESVTTSDVGGGFATPRDDDPITNIAAGLGMLGRRDVQRAFFARSLARADLPLVPASGWMLVRLKRDPELDINALSDTTGIEPATILNGIDGLVAAGYVDDSSGPQRRSLTPDGEIAYQKLVQGMRLQLEDLLSDWSPEQHKELASMLSRLASDMVTGSASAKPSALGAAT